MILKTIYYNFIFFMAFIYTDTEVQKYNSSTVIIDGANSISKIFIDIKFAKRVLVRNCINLQNIFFCNTENNNNVDVEVHNCPSLLNVDNDCFSDRNGNINDFLLGKGCDLLRSVKIKSSNSIKMESLKYITLDKSFNDSDLKLPSRM